MKKKNIKDKAGKTKWEKESKYRNLPPEHKHKAGQRTQSKGYSVQKWKSWKADT